MYAGWKAIRSIQCNVKSQHCSASWIVNSRIGWHTLSTPSTDIFIRRRTSMHAYLNICCVCVSACVDNDSTCFIDYHFIISLQVNWHTIWLFQSESKWAVIEFWIGLWWMACAMYGHIFTIAGWGRGSPCVCQHSALLRARASATHLQPWLVVVGCCGGGCFWLYNFLESAAIVASHVTPPCHTTPHRTTDSIRKDNSNNATHLCSD